MTARRLWWILTAGVSAWILAQLQWGLGMHWDEIEFFRATQWLGEGKLPYRDFWEHHTPLQWFVFAPIARWFGNGCGVAAVLPMRWAQLLLWAGIVALLVWWMRRVEASNVAAITVLLLFGTSTVVATSAIEYRVDVVANLLLLGAFALIVRGKLWIISGVLLSMSVLANIRLAPLIIAATMILLFVRIDERRWGWNPKALLLIVGGLLEAGAFAMYVRATGSDAGAVDGLIRYNVVSDQFARDIERNSFWSILFLPFRDLDLAGVLLLVASIVGILLALRGIGAPGPAQVLALVALISVLLQQRLAVHYAYHLQTFYVLCLPLAALAVDVTPASGRPFRRHLAGEDAGDTAGQRPALQWIVALALILNVAKTLPNFGERLRYQDRVMCASSALTEPDDVVFDGVGYALERKPAYRYWFLPAGLQLLASRRLVEPYDLPQLLANPPGAIVYTHRVFYWFTHFPRLGEYVSRHYVPVYRNLWIPGLSGQVSAQQSPAWLVPVTGRYRIYAHETLARHPWFSSPLKSGVYAGPDASDLLVPLRRFGPDAGLRWSIDGRPVSTESGVLTLEKGNVLSVTSASPRTVGMFVVREGVSELFVAPSGQFEF